ncbi:MAG: sulfurtransferase [Lautropia sp.]|nr:sulfurtransferase [Lautropia sp.]
MRSAAPPQLLDVRRAPVFEQSADLIAGAVWRDPERIADWALLLDPTRPVVVYCVHGHQVSQGCAGMLAELGLAAAFLEGGIEAWKTASGATAARDCAEKAGGKG